MVMMLNYDDNDDDDDCVACSPSDCSYHYGEFVNVVPLKHDHHHKASIAAHIDGLDRHDRD